MALIAWRGAVALGVATALCFLSGCTASGRTLHANDLPAVARQAGCSHTVYLEGDPNYFSRATGFTCHVSADDGLTVRVFDSADGALKAMDDWYDVVDRRTQLVYSGSWLATGPADLLARVFDRFAKQGPVDHAPTPRPLTENEKDREFCSQLVYSVLSKFTTKALADLSQYERAYPGVHNLVQQIDARIPSDRIRGLAPEDDVLIAVESHFDAQIKWFCTRSSRATVAPRP